MAGVNAMNFSNHYKQLSDEHLFIITMAQADLAGHYLATSGFAMMSELNDLGNMMLMGAEMNR
jgi:hypothetical protein